MDHCILRPLYPLFSPCQWSLIAPRTISNVEDEDEEKSGENRQRPRALQLRRGGSAKRESEGTIQELPRDHPKEACLPAMALREFSSPSICRYSPRVRLLLHLERAGAGAAFKHMSAFVCHRDSLRCSLARPFAIRTCGTQIVLRISHANNPLPSSYCALLQLSCVIVLFFFLTFHISSDCSHVLSSSRWYLSLAFCTHISLSLSLSLSRERNSSWWLNLYETLDLPHVVYLRPESMPRITDLTVWHFANFECNSSRLNFNIDLLNNRCRDVH